MASSKLAVLDRLVLVTVKKFEFFVGLFTNKLAVLNCSVLVAVRALELLISFIQPPELLVIHKPVVVRVSKLKVLLVEVEVGSRAGALR